MAPKTSAKGKAAPVIEDEGASASFEFPCAKYKKNLKNPDGYDVKRVETEAELKKLGPEWKDSPADL